MTNPSPITLSAHGLRARILPRGATLSGLWLEGRVRSVVLGFDDPADHQRVPIYAGAIVGPVANRVTRGKLVINGTSFQMPVNEDSGATLHSADTGLHRVLWDVAEADAQSVHLTTTLPHGHGGLPGLRRLSVSYALEPGPRLSLRIEATSDRPTVMNVAHHPYWNLAGTGTVKDHRLHLAGDRYLPTDAGLLPTGQTAPLSDLGLSATHPVMLDHASALDHNICLADAPPADPVRAARLAAADGLTLDIATTEPGLQVYDGAGLPQLDGVTALGAPFAPYAGIALEPQGWPDAPNHAGFPSILLQAGHRYCQNTTYSFGIL